MAQFSRIKVWIRERLRFADLNAEFNNVLNNMNPSGIDGASTDLTAYQADTAPAPGGTPSLPTNLLGELQRLRYVLRRLGGGAYWYSDVGFIASASPSSMFAYLPASGNTTAEALVDYLQQGGLLNALSQSSADVATSDFDASNKKFGNYAMKVSTTAVYALRGRPAQSLSLSVHFRNLAAGDYIAYNPQLGIELYLDGSGFLTARVRGQGAASETAKTFTTVAGAVSRAANTSFQHVVLRARLNAVAGAGSDLLNLLLNGADEGSQQNAVSIPVGVGDGGVWFLSARPNTPSWDHYSAMSVPPDAESSSPWTLSASGGSQAVSGGVLTISVGTLESGYYTRTSGVNLAQQTLEMKVKASALTQNHEVVLAYLADSSMSRSMGLYMYNGYLLLRGTDGVVQKRIPIASNQWNTIRVTSFGSPDPVIKVYLNGMLVCSYSNTASAVIGADDFEFGINSSSGAASVQFEYYSYISSVAATVYPALVAAPSATGQLDDFLAVEEQLSDVFITALGSSPASAVYGSAAKRGLQLSESSDLGVLSGAAGGRVSELEAYVVSDGKTPLSFEALGQIYSTLTPAYDYVIQLQQGAASPSSPILGSQTSRIVASTVANILSLAANRVLPLGVHRIGLRASSFNVGDTFSGEFTLLTKKGNEVL